MINLKKSFIALAAVIAVVAGTTLAVQATNAFGWNSGMGNGRALEDQAEILGTDADALAQELEEKTLPEILEEHNMTQEQFESAMEGEMTEHMKARGLTDEEIQERLTQHEERQQAHLETFASLMGIDAATLEKELATSSMPELLDKYGVSHVEVHDAQQDFRESNDMPVFGHRGHGMGMMN